VSPREFLSGRVTLHPGDCRTVLASLPEASVDSVVTDPPYALVSILKRFGSATAAPAKGNDAYMRASAGFMHARWDTGEVAFDPGFWADVCRVLKPGGYCVAMGGDRTFHRLYCAIEDGGLEPRHTAAYLYGSGFPKSRNISKDLENVEWCTCD
jgi:site-specific DNA-methyltransferase (adenine-specific)